MMTDGQFEKIASCESVVKTYLLWYLDGKNASPGSVQMEPNASQGRKWLFTWAGALTIERLLAFARDEILFSSELDTGQYSG